MCWFKSRIRLWQSCSPSEHNADSTVTWLDPGSELWGHEFRDRNGYSLMSPYMNLLALSEPLNFKLPRDDRSLHCGLSDG